MEIDLNNNKKIKKSISNVFQRKKDATNSKLTLETLNLDCFLMILDHLDCYSMIDLSDVNAEFETKVFAYEQIFKSKLFEIPEFLEFKPLVEDYGQYICKLDVSEYSILREKFSMKFNRLLEAVVGHLVPGNLTELTLRFGVVKVDNSLLESALPYFCNLKHFAFSACSSDDYSRAQEHVLNEIIGNAQQLTSLDIRYVRTMGNWYRFNHIKNLQHLTFLFVELVKYAPFREFIQSRPPLKTLVLSTESVHHQHICRLVFRHVPDLMVFEIRNSYLQLPHGDDFDFSPVPWPKKVSAELNNDDNQQQVEDNDQSGNEDEDADEDDEVDDNETTFEDSDDESDFDFEESDSDIDDVRDPDFSAGHDHITNWNLIYAGMGKMKNLKKTWLKSHFTNCSDLYDSLKVLAKNNTVNYLTIQVSTQHLDLIQNDDFLAQPFPQNFTALKTLRLVSPSNDTRPFLRHFIQALPNMTKCILDMDTIDRTVQDTIATVVEAASNLKTFGLKMPAMNLDHLLYMKLIGIKYAKSFVSSKSTPLHIYINSKPQKAKCETELKDHYDENVIAIKVKSFMTWENDPL